MMSWELHNFYYVFLSFHFPILIGDTNYLKPHITISLSSNSCISDMFLRAAVLSDAQLMLVTPLFSDAMDVNSSLNLAL